ncbi:ribbon-helix-helix domain-containing protein [Ruania albidiflava]|uniref:ribbon-helix-helix domain-containing protein n=1 Tax=Ruania albidiflava TaxID=366586 RepID=UPI0023F209B9|nr:ribbon-helix-helix domain-containing protein [Ruania albidiflava]
MARETVQGKQVTDAQIQKWADEAERGYPVEELRRRGRPTKGAHRANVVPVRMEPSLLKALDEFASTHAISRSDAIRDAVRRYIDVA